MMYDIYALQKMYGADYTTNSGNTTYSWNPDEGDTYVNGVKAIDSAGVRIFMTVWDGGGEDTYDLSAYTTNIKVDLQPGKYSALEYHQLAYLGWDGNNRFANGCVYNAMMVNGDTRSLIEDATTGSGNDTLTGNQVANFLQTGLGNDTVTGNDGDDTIWTGAGNDTASGNYGNDLLNGFAGNDTLNGGNGDDTLNGGADGDTLVGAGGSDRLVGGTSGLAEENILTGGSNADTFVFDLTDTNGMSTATDFVHGTDHIEINGSTVGISNWTQLKIYISDSGTDCVIDLSQTMPGPQIWLENVHKADLAATDFVFV
jgi:serralysin